MDELKPVTGMYLDNICMLNAVDRIKSPDWQRGFLFDPEFSSSGKLMSIYTEPDSLFRKRTIEKIKSGREKIEVSCGYRVKK